MYEIAITAVVPLVCHIEAARLLCNSPRGYEVYARDAANVSRLIDRGDGPVNKPVAYEIRDGEHLIVVAR